MFRNRTPHGRTPRSRTSVSIAVPSRRAPVPFLARFALLLAAGLLAAGPAAARDGRAAGDARDIVGEITTVIGSGRIHAGERARQAARGEPVHAGERIETDAGGHVHVRFVDGALVSVRPRSRLTVEAYRPGQAQGAIKFRLDEGVVRSITGAWGEAHRERFRLNTPLAAIGIKGTDFVVRSADDATRATVFSGAIVMAPLQGECALALGPCADNASHLSAEMAHLMLELPRHGPLAAPRLVPAVDLLAASVAPRSDRGDPAAAGRLAPLETAARQWAGAPPEAAPPRSPHLAWLHNIHGWNVPAGSIGQRYDEALAAGRSAVIGNFFITLYRDETTLKTFAPQGAAASFALREASAVYIQPAFLGRPDEHLAVSGARLDVDFAQARFATHLDLSGPSLGRTALAAAGAIDAAGRFIDHRPGQSVAGAFSLDGREAGYFFGQTLPGGTVSGLTLWGR